MGDAGCGCVNAGKGADGALGVMSDDEAIPEGPRRKLGFRIKLACVLVSPDVEVGCECRVGFDDDEGPAMLGSG